MICAPSNLKHRMILMTTYSAGLRAGEVIKLKAEHIDSERMLIKVAKGKGKKDRYTMLSPKLLGELRNYYKKCRPKTYLFPSTYKKTKPLAYETVREIYEKARKKVGIKNGEGLHTLRHSVVYPPLEGHASTGSRIRYSQNTSADGPYETDHHNDLPACEPRNPVKNPQSTGSY